MRSSKRNMAALVLGLAIIPGAAFAVNPNSTTIPSTGQSLDIQIDSPPDGVTVAALDPVDVTGVVGIGGLATDANVVYVVDVSGSTEFNSGLDCDGSGDATGDDFNGDGAEGTTLDCEISGVIALNDSFGSLTGVDAGIVPFGSSAVVADVDPAAGQQDFTRPLDVDNNGNSTPDLEEVLRSLDVGAVNQFTAFSFASGTDFDDALTSMNAAFAGQPAGEDNIAFFLSDGEGSLATGPGTPLQAAIDAGTIVNTYAVGSAVTGECDAGEQLEVIASSTGGTCTVVADPADLAGTLGGSTPAGIDRVEVSIDGGPPILATLDALGNFSATIPAADVTGPTHLIEATVFADDPDATSVTADVTINVQGASTATINVLKQVDSDPDGAFDDDASGWMFEVSRTDAGTVASGTTGADGMLTFEVEAADGYRVSEATGPAGLWSVRWVCTDDDTGFMFGAGGGLFPPALTSSALDLTPEQSVTCTFDNQLLAGFMTGGGQITDDVDARGKQLRPNKVERISFGGNVGVELDGSLRGQWQANLHNVSDDALDKGKFHSTSIDLVVLADLGSIEGAAPPESLYNFIEFSATGRFNGEDGWSVFVTATDTGEPGNGANSGDDADSIRIRLYRPDASLAYDSSTDFPAEQGPRHELDHGNLQIHPPED